VILLDTNVVSETMRPIPDARVISWLNAQASDTVYLSTVSLAELLLGIAVLPDGRRKSDLASSLADKVVKMFGPRLLSFNPASAQAYALLVSRARATGRSIGLADGLIAAIATAHGLAVATRDIVPFAAAGVLVINPWSDP
jgi:predicted nucleic acid-binding protein